MIYSDDVERVFAGEVPAWTMKCSCGAKLERWHRQEYVDCSRCGAEYNSSGQQLTSDWRGNSSWWDDEVGDLEGDTIQHADY